MGETILSADIGGTNTRLQLSESTPQGLNIIACDQFTNHKHASLSEIIRLFLAEHSPTNAPHRGCFAVAGPIVNGTVKFTNLPWFIEKNALKRDLQLTKLELINDFEAIGYGIETLNEEDIYVLQRGQYQTGMPKALIGAGTGLGVALAYKANGHFQVVATEGGHVDFAPRDEEQFELLRHLKRKLHRVSVERVVSGPGLINIYKYVCDNTIYHEQENPDLRLALHNPGDGAATIYHYATEHQDPLAARALDIFIKVYGAVVGNLALTTLPHGGLYIVGGIAPKMLSELNDGRFLNAYSDKGRMSKLLHDIPIYIVLNTQIGLQGAAVFASRL